MQLIQKIAALADAAQKSTIKIRRDFHKYPETGWQEFRTASLVAAQLAKSGYQLQLDDAVINTEYIMGRPSEAQLEEQKKRALAQGGTAEWLAKMTHNFTGLVATLQCGKQDGPVIGLRFDLDANDIQETDAQTHLPNQAGFASVNDRSMHACGHDGHLAVGLTVAQILASLKDQLHGTIKLIFQPAEEGVRGARAMVEKGIVDDVDYMLGAHFGFQMKKTGTIACSVNGFLATSKYDARFTGIPAHAGAFPEEGKNALLAAACAALNLHSIARHSAGASRINVGTLQAGSGRNIIADKAFLQLETRGATSDINTYMSEEAKRILKAAALMYDVQLTTQQTGGAAGGSSSPRLGKFIEETAHELGIFSQIIGECNFGASEDYSYFMERVQANGGAAAYMMIGADLAAGHHDDHFTFDEKALNYAVKIIAAVAAKLLQEK